MNNFKKVALYAAVSLAAGLSAPAVLSQQAADVNVSSSAAAAAVSHGATAIVDADVKDVNESVDNKVKRAHKVSKNPHFELEKKVKDYLRENNLRAGGTTNARGKVIFYKVIDVDGNKASSDFFRQVELAYEKAYLGALKDFSYFLVNKTSSEIFSEFFNDDSSNAGEFKNEKAEGVSKIQAIGEKILALSEAHLDQMLQKAGVDPSQYSSRPKDEKIRLLNDVFMTRTKSATSTQMSGITILDNFITINEDGKASGSRDSHALTNHAGTCSLLKEQSSAES